MSGNTNTEVGVRRLRDRGLGECEDLKGRIGRCGDCEKREDCKRGEIMREMGDSVREGRNKRWWD